MEHVPASPRVMLVYASKAAPGLSIDDIGTILDASERNNQKSSITGMLCYGNGYFVQCLEGPRLEVNETYLRIGGDPRHNEPLLLSYSEIEMRSFPGWSMGYLGLTIDAQRMLRPYSGGDGFNPMQLKGLDAVNLLLELKNGLSSQTVSR